MDEAARRRGRLMLLLLGALFLGPLLFSWAYSRLGFHWHPEPALSGLLIDPPVELPPDAMKGLPAAPWKLIVVGPCDAACWKTLVDLRQIARSLPRYQDALVRVYVHRPGQALAPTRLQEQAGLLDFEDGDGRLLAALAGAAPPADTAFVMVDPRGFAMLRYRKDYDPRAARKDIDHLLRRFVPN
ncbi:hypothetical protein [Immundisolibacter sp.]|uniref:hypothetical protein n=1 Tax=Immundisolibacter sp. TaxID=1934948 RepID=UPI00261D4D1F|nr:hypothetical protein [Immundisolibacter sp.]MDD3650246.1 hypothetical protein [Immundisolibacter sp.]